MRELFAKAEKKARLLRDELELVRRVEVLEIQERKNGHINTLMKKHEKVRTGGERAAEGRARREGCAAGGAGVAGCLRPPRCLQRTRLPARRGSLTAPPSLHRPRLPPLPSSLLPQAFGEIKSYYNDITHNNLDLIRSLKEELADMNKKVPSGSQRQAASGRRAGAGARWQRQHTPLPACARRRDRPLQPAPPRSRLTCASPPLPLWPPPCPSAGGQREAHV